MTRHGIASILAAGLVLFLPASAASFETVAVMSGVVTVPDGDDVRFGQINVRLQGIAAPEDGRDPDPGGPESTANLRAIAEGRYVVCHLDGTTAGRSMRPAGICYLGDRDLGRYQVETGHARDCPAYSGGRYADAEAHAVAAGSDLSAIYDLPGYC